MAHIKKPSPNTGKVSTVRLTKGASVSRHERTEISVIKMQKRFSPVYASMPLSPRKARHFPPSSGEADAKEERNYSFKMYYLIDAIKR